VSDRAASVRIETYIVSAMKFKFGDRVVHAKRPEWGPGTITRVESTFHEGEPAQRLHIRFPGVGLKVMNTGVAPLRHASEVEDRLEQPASEAYEPPVPVVNGTPRRDRSASSRPTEPRANRNGSAPAPASKPNARPQTNSNSNSDSQSNASSSSSSHAASSASRRAAPAAATTKPADTGWLADLEKRNPEDVMLDIPEEAKDPFRSIWDRLQASLDLYRFTKTQRGIFDWAIAQSGLEDPLTRFNRQELETFFNRWMRIRDQHLLAVLIDAEKKDAERAKRMLASAPAEAQQAMRRLYARR